MKKLIVQFSLFFAISMVVISCGNNTASKEQDAAEKSNTETTTGNGTFAEAAKNLEKAAQDMQGKSGEAVEPVDFRVLKGLLPAAVNGMPLSNPSGEKTGMMNIKVATAKGEYRNNDSKIELTIVDMGGMSGAISMMAAWSLLDIDREDDNGYEKSSTYNGFKAYEKYRKDSKDGEMSVLVANRFIVTSNGNNVDMAVIKKAIDAINLQKLQSVK